MATIGVNGVTLTYELQGDGAPLVLVHGGFLNRRSWDGVVPQLASRYRVVTYDLRGHGDSERPSTLVTAADHVADLESLISALEFAPAHVAGQSLGATVPLRLAGHRPELFRSLALHEPLVVEPLLSDPATKSLYVELAANFETISKELRGGDMSKGAMLFVDKIAAPGAWDLFPPALQQSFIDNAPTYVDASIDSDLLEADLGLVADLPFPVLLTNGAASPPWFGASVAKLAEALGSPRRHTFPTAGHGPQMTHPVEYGENLKQFLDDAESARPSVP